MPERHRLSRGRGWRKPAGVVVVARPSRWGNPFVIRRGAGSFELEGPGLAPRRYRTAAAARAAAVEAYRMYLSASPGLVAAARRELAGRDVACWCPLDEPCHGDVLLEVAGSSEDTTARAAPTASGDRAGPCRGRPRAGGGSSQR